MNQNLRNGIVWGVVLVLLAGLVAWYTGLIPNLPFSRSSSGPDLDHTVAFTAQMSPEAHTILEKNINATKDELRSNPENLNAWLDLAIEYKTAGDFKAAVEVWQYLSKHYPNEAVSLHNLGEYYFHEKKDYAKAESYYRQAITVMPNFGSNYTDLYEMYRYAQNDQAKAVAILQEGIGNTKELDRASILVVLASYYRDLGNSAEARKSYVAARDLARAARNTQMVNLLNAEISRLH
ncbi:tetratricopeptide repeat protein [Candidatus Kaiserbacteria bacterium]|nr:tetratricopeptide repeat protein [Candidatus Kaiserbacteria bacterium]